jgi:hypothetical protein
MEFKNLFKIEKDKRNIIVTSSILAATLAIGIVAGVQFKQFSDYETYFYVRDNIKIEKFSDYSPNLKNTAGDADIYKIEGKNPGPSVLILGGTHPNEPSGQITATLFLENIEVEAGTVYVITETNKSAYTHSHPLEATAFYYDIETQNSTRKFKFGSRATNTNQQWPNPDVYTTQSGQKLSSTDTRNLNRSYPGKKDGTYTEQVAFAITELIKQNDIAVTIDLHEASPEYITINAIVFHQDAAAIASSASINMDMWSDVKISAEESPTNLHGLSHRELGDYTDTLALLCETSNAAQGKIRGAFTEDLIVTGEDKFYDKADELGIIYAKPVSLTERVARHTLTICEILNAYNEEYSYGQHGSLANFLDGRRLNEGMFSISNIPSYDEIMEKGVGYYLADQPKDYR